MVGVVVVLLLLLRLLLAAVAAVVGVSESLLDVGWWLVVGVVVWVVLTVQG